MTWRKFSDNDPTNGIYLSEIEYNRLHGNTESIQVSYIYHSPILVLKTLYKAAGHNKSEFYEWLNYAKTNTQIFDNTSKTPLEYFEDLKTALKSKKHIVPIIVFFHRFNQPNNLNEGRHRALAAYELGMKNIPVIEINKNYS